MKNDTTQFPSIKTEISGFCQEFADLLSPFEHSLQESLKDIQRKPDSDAVQRPLAGLADVHHRMETLLNKVKEQQAYVIIFGPLKSGKSTLMNAISGSYVSEVTSLPAYPCLVHVKHGDDNRFTVSRYNGDKIPYADNRSLQMLVQENHRVLAQRLREVEDRGEEFDPGVHYPDAIRRIDVEVPAQNLKESLTVLVDTPGLYTRMKFGYDLMTKEFRNSAACAVFVVKTDNLFLEQVFEEFNELLDLFSRIFLVVNIDTSKRDLDQDGTLKASLESEAPDEVIKAFESLVMSAPLRKAAEEGRLRIYPIDLLNSAAESLKPAKIEPVEEVVEDSGEAKVDEGEDGADFAEKSHEESTEEAPAEETAEADDSIEGLGVRSLATKDHPIKSFSVFLNDLTEYLNSNDYLLEFMGDSLHLGKTLATEIQTHCSSSAIEGLRERQAALRRELGEASERLTAVEKLEALDWKDAFQRVRKEAKQGADAFGKKAEEETKAEGLKKLDDWFESDDSVAALQRNWNTLLNDRREEVVTNSSSRARGLVSSSLEGADLGIEFRRSIDQLDTVLTPALQEARTAVEEDKVKKSDCSVQIPLESIDLKKGVWDWVLFRSQASIRRRIFGDEDSLDKPVPSAVKKKRLGEEGKTDLRSKLTTHLEGLFPGVAISVSDHIFTLYTETLTAELSQRLQAGKAEYVAKRKGLEARLRTNRQIQEQMEQLSKTSGDIIEGIFALKEKYQAVTWEREVVIEEDLESSAESDEELEDGFAPESEESREPELGKEPGEEPLDSEPSKEQSEVQESDRIHP